MKHSGLRALMRRLSTPAALALVAGLLLGPATSYADHVEDHSDKVGVCHETGSGRYVFIEVGAPAAEEEGEDGHGHGQHEGDKIGVDSAEDCPDDVDKDQLDKDEENKDKSDEDNDDDGSRGRGHGQGTHPGRGRGLGAPGR